MTLTISVRVNEAPIEDEEILVRNKENDAMSNSIWEEKK